MEEVEGEIWRKWRARYGVSGRGRGIEEKWRWRGMKEVEGEIWLGGCAGS